MTTQIVSAQRTIIAPKNGALAGMSLSDLSAPVIRACLAQAGITPDQVDEVIVSNALGGCGNPARLCALAAGIPHAVAGLSIDRQCVGGLDALLLAKAMIEAGQAHVIVAGGVESYSTRPIRLASQHAAAVAQPYDRPAFAPAPMPDPDMDRAMAQVAQKYDLQQRDMDDWAMRSHANAIAARDRLKREIVAVAGSDVTHDPYARPLTDRLCARAPQIDGPITYANTAIAADGAAFVIMVSPEFAKKHDLAGVNVVFGKTVAAAPHEPAIAPVYAIDQVLATLNITPHALTHIEMMEAYAAQAMLCTQLTKLPVDRVNLQGGALARGHPIGASGAVLAVRLFHDIMAANAGLGLAAIAAAGGLGTAVVLQRRS